MKAILVIDVPNDYDFETAIAIVDVMNEKGEGVVAMRPLKPMPKQLTEADISWSERRGFRGGWNACLEEITGERE